MCKSPELARSVIDGRAGRVAYEIGQLVERMLVDRAVQFAASEAVSHGEVLVTLDHVRRALDKSLLEEACAQVGVVFDGKAKAPRSRPAA